MHDLHIYKAEGGGMMYDWGVHLIDQLLWMIPGKLSSVYADVRNVINDEVDDYFKILLRFEHGITAEIELGTYCLHDNPGWFTHHWYLLGSKGTAHVDGFRPSGKITRTKWLLSNANDTKTKASYGPTRSFGEPAEGLILTEDIPQMSTAHENYFDNFFNAWEGREDILVTIDQVERVLRVMEAAWRSSECDRLILFED